MKKTVPIDAVLIPGHAKKVFSGVIYDVYQWEQEEYDGSKKTYEMLRRPDSAMVIPVVDNKLLLLDETQPVRGRLFTFPGGKVDSGDQSVLDGVKRELVEETGYTFHNWKLLNVVQRVSKMEWFIYIYLAWSVENKIDTNHEVGEIINPTLVPFDEVRTRVLNGEKRLNENSEIFKKADNLEDLLGLPEYKGKEIIR